MGLDMYLYRTSKDQEKLEKPEEVNKTYDFKKTLEEMNKGDFAEQRREWLTEETRQVAYWRKFNALHAWIVNNLADGVDECQEIPVSSDDLDRIIVQLQKEHRREESELVPTSGFFFGSTEKDGLYWQDVEASLKGLQHVRDTTDFKTQRLVYVASW